jgi:DNA-directed RNA polymerase subunit M/transcription elongation factor TFIIS
MQFCKQCDNKLFPIEEDSKLWNKCMDCNFKEEYSGSVIDKKNYKNKDTITSENNKFLIYDPTIPRTTQKICPNKNCITFKDPKVKQEAVFIQNPITIKLTYICVNCNTEWKYS